MQLISAGISALIAVSTFLLLHLFIDPYKEKKRRKEESLKKLYSPLYALIVARGHVYHLMKLSVKQDVMLGSIKEHEFLTKQFTDKLIFENLAYASSELINAWGQYVAADVGPTPKEVVENFVRIAVKEYNGLKKQLGIDYDKEEYSTGIPRVFKKN